MPGLQADLRVAARRRLTGGGPGATPPPHPGGRGRPRRAAAPDEFHPGGPHLVERLGGGDRVDPFGEPEQNPGGRNPAARRPARWPARSSRWRCRPRPARPRPARAARCPAARPPRRCPRSRCRRPHAAPLLNTVSTRLVSKLRVELRASGAGHTVRRPRRAEVGLGGEVGRRGPRGSHVRRPRAHSLRASAARNRLIAAAAAAPPSTASEPPSQKSFCTSTITSARTARGYGIGGPVGPAGSAGARRGGAASAGSPAPTSAGVPPVMRTSSANEVGNTVCGCPAAAQTTS